MKTMEAKNRILKKRNPVVRELLAKPKKGGKHEITERKLTRKTKEKENYYDN